MPEPKKEKRKKICDLTLEEYAALRKRAHELVNDAEVDVDPAELTEVDAFAILTDTTPR